MILGILSACLFVLTMATAFFKRFRCLHRWVGLVFLLTVLLHAVMVWPLMDRRPLGVYVLGGIAALGAGLGCISGLMKKKLGKRWKLVHRLSAVLVSAAMVLHIGAAVCSLLSYQKAVDNLDVQSISIEEVADGTYEGACDVGYIYAKVRVTVENGHLTDIQLLEHRHERGALAEQITGNILSQQRLDVDTVSSATNSSKVIQKAIENALKEGLS